MLLCNQPIPTIIVVFTSSFVNKYSGGGLYDSTWPGSGAFGAGMWARYLFVTSDYKQKEKVGWLLINKGI